ncbi:MAG: hypothetical protein JST66_14005 [Bacteroidetes bacterium]|nr:hypothetical protein [Bacteroidota bacterium]
MPSPLGGKASDASTGVRQASVTMVEGGGASQNHYIMDRPTDEKLMRVYHTLDRVAPILWPMFWVLLSITLAIVLVFGGLLVKHQSIGWSGLDLGATSATGTFWGGVLGPLIGGISSVLLIITLLFQAKEYELSREELIKSVAAQADSARAHEQQKVLLQEQVADAKRESNLNMITLSIRELKEDARSLASEGFGIAVSGFSSLVASIHRYVYDNQAVIVGRDFNQAGKHMSVIYVAVAKVILIADRAQRLYDEIGTLDLPPTQRTIRKADLIMFIKTELTRLNTVALLWEIHQAMENARTEYPGSLKYRQLATEHLKSTVDRLMAFSNMDFITLNP